MKFPAATSSQPRGSSNGSILALHKGCHGISYQGHLQGQLQQRLPGIHGIQCCPATVAEDMCISPSSDLVTRHPFIRDTRSLMDEHMCMHTSYCLRKIPSVGDYLYTTCEDMITFLLIMAVNQKDQIHQQLSFWGEVWRADFDYWLLGYMVIYANRASLGCYKWPLRTR